MAEDPRARAEAAYNALITMLENRHLRYDPNPEDKTVNLVMQGDDLPMHMHFRVLERYGVVQLLSSMAMKVPEDRRMEAAVAVAVANYGIVNGSFDYDINDGEIRFRITAAHRGQDIVPEQLSYMLNVATDLVDRYNDRFYALSKGFLTLDGFIAKEKES